MNVIQKFIVLIFLLQNIQGLFYVMYVKLLHYGRVPGQSSGLLFHFAQRALVLLEIVL
ncbi:8-oxo-dGDP phosphatase NUDT18 [Bienertia sinuspersici]